MRLDFNVLWVDDQPDRITSQISPIERQMGEHGFQFKPVLCKTLEEVSNWLTDQIFNDEIDLILVDWDLGGGVWGQDAIRKVRESIPYKDVVFYSANANVDSLRRHAFENGLEGIYFSNREGLVGEVVGVFESLVKKVLDLDHTRGIVMGATSDIDFMIQETLVTLHDRLDENGRRSMLEIALARIEEKLADLNQKVAELKSTPALRTILKAHFIFSANDGLRLLSNVLDEAPFKETHGKYRPAVVAYMNDVVPDRNILGHQVLTPAGRPRAVIGRDGKEIEIQDMRDLRRRLLDLRKEFRALHLALKP
jgi:hypothetical protein